MLSHAAMLVILLLVAGVAPDHAQDKPVKLTLAAGGSAGSWYIGGAVMSEIVRETFPNINVTPVPGGGVANMRTIQKGEADIAFAFWSTAVEAARGEEPFKTPHGKIRAVISLFPLYLQIVVRQDGPIRAFGDLVGRKISAGRRGFVGEITFLRMLELHGMSVKDIEAKGGKVNFLDYTDSADMMQDRLLDALSSTSAIPHSSYQQIAALFPLRMLPIAEDKIQAFEKKYPGWVRSEFPAGVYKGVDAAVPTLASWSGIVARDDLAADVVYKVTKALYEKRQRLADAYPAYKAMLPKENTVLGMSVPMHPGAQQFYKEIGLVK